MPADMNLNNLEVGDWVHVPDNLYPWRTDDHNCNDIYGSVCRSAVITRSYMDGIVTIKFSDMRDYSRLGDGNCTFTYEPNIYSDELMLIMTGDEYSELVSDSTPDVPHVRVGQPRDERGRFTSSNTTERPVSPLPRAEYDVAGWTRTTIGLST